MFPRLKVEQILNESPLQACSFSAEHGKATASNADPVFERDEAMALSQGDVVHRVVDRGLRSPGSQFRIVLLTFALRDVFVR